MAYPDRSDIPRSDPGRADASRGTDAGVHATPIYTDDRGRRRSGTDLTVEPFPAVKDDPTKELRAELAALKKVFDDYRSVNDARTITGGGSRFSGTLGSGISFNPNADNGAGGGVNSDTLELELCDGTAAVFYVQSVTPAP